MCSIEARTTSQVMDVKWASTGGHSVDSGGCKGMTRSAALLNSHLETRPKSLCNLQLPVVMSEHVAASTGKHNKCCF